MRHCLDAMVIGNVGVDTQVYLPSGFDWNAPTRVEGFFTRNVDTIGQAGGYSSFGYSTRRARSPKEFEHEAE
ncbi:MAG: hypothetical protein AAFQ65_08685 [Myxococcota bacterium]